MSSNKNTPNTIKTKIIPFSLGCLTGFFGILLLLIVVFFISIMITVVLSHFDQKKCQDTGYCTKYTIFTTNEGKEIEIIKKTCLENKGKWLANEQVCIFENKEFGAH